jgi:phytoene dehydrogenase-like protein
MGVAYDAVVVGAGPNGLTAAARLARAGRRVIVFEAGATPGGGSRTRAFGAAGDLGAELGAVYDVCAAAHPFGAASPAFDELRLDRHGLTWLHPPAPLAHPFDDGSAAVLQRDLEATARSLGDDSDRWRGWVGGLTNAWDRRRHLLLDPLLAGTLRHPVAMARFAARAALPATLLTRRASTREARALVVGLAAHSGVPLSMPTTAGVALALAAATHAVGMPVAAGGSQAIVDALVAVIRSAGGHVVCDHRVKALRDLPPADAVLLDVTPRQAATITGAPPPRWKAGVAAWKLDLLLAGPMPWTSAACRTAGTVHLGGDPDAIVAAERTTYRGGLPERPFVIAVQPSVADPSRAPAGQQMLWAYRHVPTGCTDDDATAGIEAQFDRFAPGWRDLVLHRQVTTAADYAAYNPSYIGGDIAGGAMTPWQTLARPRLALDPYRMRGIDRVWLCSQSTQPGPGVHGMCGWHAAGSVLRHTR